MSYPTRMRYLLMQDFHGTVQMWRENPKQLDNEIRNHLQRVSEYAKELKAKGIPEWQREEYLSNFLAPTDVIDVPSPDENMYSQVIEWAEKMGEQMLFNMKDNRKPLKEKSNPGTTGQIDQNETQPVIQSMLDCLTRGTKIKDKMEKIDGTCSQEKYIKAYRYAAEAHMGQLVPGTDLPYIMHLSLVSMEIMAALSVMNDFDGDLAIQCALLHDTLEDTGISYDNLKDEFGIRVADGVNALTKDESIGSDLSEQERKKLQMTDSLERIKKQPKEVWMVKLADRITNLQPPPLDWDQEKISNYKQEAKLIYDNLKDASKFLADRLKEKIDIYSPEKTAMKYELYQADNFHYGDEDESDFLGVFSSAKEAIDQAKKIVDRSLRWERSQATDPNNAEVLYHRYKDFGDDPFIISDDQNCKFSAWTYAKERCREIVNEDK